MRTLQAPAKAQPQTHRRLRGAMALLLLATAAWPALAQYKVVQPDGSVTYTDRPPTSGAAKVTALGRLGTASAAEEGLPADLRQTMQRFPVVLYSTQDCQPCDAGRRLLQQRGVPYAERRVVSEEDAAALERVAGGRTVPALTIGSQPVRGFSDTEWQAYLDAAGYPRESRLPRNWQQPEPATSTPAERGVQLRPAAVTAPPARAAAPAPDPETPVGLRF
ncbi:glutaredoxin family protein [Rubrivivax sp. A210]|uniref:glutaredoxin family protein n=1 Tax=Rubrivivax sp. A210 TaxID=2772301 RepID=UPI001F43C8E8|nr:glutaredoxin family protein [Rubrivivax sp. A210]